VLIIVYPSLSECADNVVEERDFGVGALFRSSACPLLLLDPSGHKYGSVVGGSLLSGLLDSSCGC
jgi:hypothetical protein